MKANLTLVLLVLSLAMVPISKAANEKLVNELPIPMKPFVVEGPWVVVRIASCTRDNYGVYHVDRVVVESVTPGSPAERLGLKKGQRVIRIGDDEVEGISSEDFNFIAFSKYANKAVSYTVYSLWTGKKTVVLPVQRPTTK